MTERHLYTNRLINQKSPYLQQHAHNPIEWYPWGEEAFETALREDKPIFLSIGYSTCHWCHVMAEESFEDPSIAKLMNRTFINIKVDKEELPEVDSIYMEFAQSMISGAAGWPLNVILTQNLEPFFASTYLPPHNKQGMMGLSELIDRIDKVWNSEERDQVTAQASKITEIFSQAVHTSGEKLPDKDVIERLLRFFYQAADPIYGGLKGAPKFPIGYQILFLLNASALQKDGRALFLAERTLVMMQRGGIFDHLDGGFSRYSTDEKWLVPHFEKMLYDNAFLADAYLQVWLLNKRPFYKSVCESILDYVLERLRGPEQAFYSAEDADSGGHEGAFYSWSYEELCELLNEKERHLFFDYYHITREGNFEGHNILHIEEGIDEFAASHKLNVEEVKESLQRQKQILREARAKRTQPLKDDKILTAWNGLIIHSLASAGVALNRQDYLDAAEGAARFIRQHLWIEKKLYRRWRDGEVAFKAILDDYAGLIRGLLTLFEAHRGSDYLAWAIELSAAVKRDYKAPLGAFYQTDGSDPYIILRKCHFADGAEASGNAIQCENLIRLYQITGDPQYREDAEDILKAVKKFLDLYPIGYCYHTMNLARYYNLKAPVFTISCNRRAGQVAELGSILFPLFIPHKTIVWHDPNDPFLNSLPALAKRQALEDKTTLYICSAGVCQKPLTDLSEIAKTIHSMV